MIVLLDASVLVAAFTPDIHSTQAERWLEATDRPVVSDWAAAEFSAAIRTKVRQGVVRGDRIDAVEAAFDDWILRLGARQQVLAQDHLKARALVIKHPLLRAPDALHIAIAVRLSARLATFDDRQSDAARMESVPLFAK